MGPLFHSGPSLLLPDRRMPSNQHGGNLHRRGGYGEHLRNLDVDRDVCDCLSDTSNGGRSNVVI